MSHHLDSPTAREDGRVDITDVYLFAGEQPHTTALILAVNPLAGQLSPTTFRAGALYEFKIDTNADAIEDLSFRLIFGEPDREGIQSVELRRAEGQQAEYGNDGIAIAQGTSEQIVSVAGGGRLWTGLAADPFFFNVDGYTQFRSALAENRFDPSAFDNAKNFAQGLNVTAIVLELPNTAFHTETIHFWATTSIQHEDRWITINRAATPLMQPIFNFDAHLKDRYNKDLPRHDVVNYGQNIVNVVAKVSELAGTVTDANAYGQQVARLLLPDMLPYDTRYKASYSFACRNGRALADDVGDVMLTLLTNMPLSDGVSKAVKYRSSFPYLPLPNSLAPQ